MSEYRNRTAVTFLPPAPNQNSRRQNGCVSASSIRANSSAQRQSLCSRSRPYSNSRRIASLSEIPCSVAYASTCAFRSAGNRTPFCTLSIWYHMQTPSVKRFLQSYYAISTRYGILLPEKYKTQDPHDLITIQITSIHHMITHKNTSHKRRPPTPIASPNYREDNPGLSERSNANEGGHLR